MKRRSTGGLLLGLILLGGMAATEGLRPAAAVSDSLSPGRELAAPTQYRLQTGPRASDRYVVWTEKPRTGPTLGGAGVRGLDLRTHTPITITAELGNQINPAVAGTLVAWEDYGHSCAVCDGDILARDLATGTAYAVATGAADQFGVALAGSSAAWIEITGDSTRLLLRDLAADPPAEIVAYPATHYIALGPPALNAGYLVWQESLPLADNAAAGGTRLRVFDRATRQVRTVATSPRLDPGRAVEYAPDGPHLVWTDTALHVLDLATGAILAETPGPAMQPFLRGDYVLWATPDSPTHSADVWSLRLSDPAPVPLVSAAYGFADGVYKLAQGLFQSQRAVHPLLVGNQLVWEAWGEYADDNRILSAEFQPLFDRAWAREQALRSPPGGAGGDPLYFAATGHRVGDHFRAYWEAHGGAAGLGRPISEEVPEVYDPDRTIQAVQYFERAVLDLRPQNPAPVAVLPRLLGLAAYQARYGPVVPGASDQQTSSDTPRGFPASGKTLGGAFRVYWEAQGSQARFGVPISDEVWETDPLTGAPHLAQYFEYAVLERPADSGEVTARPLGQAAFAARYDGRTSGGLPALPAPAPAPPTPAGPADLRSVDMVRTDEGWAVGAGGTILHYMAGRWEPAPSPVQADITSVRMISAAEGWAVAGFHLLHYTAGRWAEAPMPLDAPLLALDLQPTGEGWAVGEAVGAIPFLHYRDGVWLPNAPVATYALAAKAVAGRADGTAWAVGPGTLLTYRAGRWAETRIPRTGFLAGIAVGPAGDAWAVGDECAILHYSAGAWQTVPCTEHVNLTAVSLGTANDGWAVGGAGVLLHYQAGAWIRDDRAPTSQNLTAVRMLSADEGWAVGAAGTILHYHSGVWQQARP